MKMMVLFCPLSVLPDHRGKGIGASLVREAERIVKEEIGARRYYPVCRIMEQRINWLVWYVGLVIRL